MRHYIKKICIVCKKEFEVIPARDKTAKCCSYYCTHEYFKTISHPHTKESRLKISIANNKRVKTECSFCGKIVIKKRNSMRLYKYHYCSIKCMAEAYSVRLQKDNNPNWVDGRSFIPYSPAFNKQLKERIRVRDNFTCQLCGVPELEFYQKLSIHHIDYNKDNYDLSNLITLCRNCNSQVNSKRELWQDHFKRKLLHVI